jgi:hypothetical protein
MLILCFEVTHPSSHYLFLLYEPNTSTEGDTTLGGRFIISISVPKHYRCFVCFNFVYYTLFFMRTALHTGGI